jgi:tRNA (cytidine56-2'-O)-methyltransferase
MQEQRGEALVVVGAEKVPTEVFGICDVNVAVGNQPHSEVAALALFLDRYFGGVAHRREFAGARLTIEPSAKGKQVRDRGARRASTSPSGTSS